MPDPYGICHQSCGACHEVYPPLLCEHKWRKTYDTDIILYHTEIHINTKEVPVHSRVFKKREEFGDWMRLGLLFERTCNKKSLPGMDTQVSNPRETFEWNVLSTQWAAAPFTKF